MYGSTLLYYPLLPIKTQKFWIKKLRIKFPQKIMTNFFYIPELHFSTEKFSLATLSKSTSKTFVHTSQLSSVADVSWYR